MYLENIYDMNKYTCEEKSPEHQVFRCDELPFEIMQCVAWDNRANQDLTSVCIYKDYFSGYEETENSSVMYYVIIIFFSFLSLKKHYFKSSTFFEIHV